MSRVAFESDGVVLPNVSAWIVWSNVHNARLTEGGRSVVVRSFGEGLLALQRAGLLPSEVDRARSGYVAPAPAAERAP